MRGHRKYTLPGKLLEGIRQEIFPERCPGCNEILFAKEKEKGFCQACAGKINRKKIGEAHVVCARTRCKYIGGIRAVYEDDLM